MKRILAFIVVAWAVPAFGQTQTMCRDLKESGGFLYQGETVINGQACRQVSYAPVQQQAVAAAPATAVPTPTAANLGVVPAQPTVVAPVAGPVSSAVTLPDSTQVKLALSTALSSASATQGQIIEFRVAEDVMVNGTVLIKKDTLALGKVTLAQGKKHMGRAGSLDIEADKTHAIDGTKVELHAEAGAKGKSKAGAMSAGMLITATGVGAPIGALWLLKHGKDATIPAGSILTAYTDDSVQVHLDASQQIVAVR